MVVHDPVTHACEPVRNDGADLFEPQTLPDQPMQLRESFPAHEGFRVLYIDFVKGLIGSRYGG